MVSRICREKVFISGIGGILNYASLGSAEKNLKNMLNILDPNPQTHHLAYYDKNIIFGYSVNHEEIKTSQSALLKKIEIKEDVCSIFSGNIINLSANKEGVKTCNNTELETLILINEIYLDKGLKGLAGLNGAWSIAIWEPGKRRLNLAVDSVGINTLYYSSDNSCIYFSSDLRALTSILGKGLDLDALSEYLHFLYVPCPKTIYAGVYAVPPGTAIIFNKEVLMQEYKFGSSRFIYNKEVVDGSSDGEDVLIKFENLLVQSVKNHKSQSGLTGILLSGGKDSSALAIAANIIAPEEFRSVTVGFEDSKVSEIKDAEKVSRYLGIPHTAYIFKNKEYFEIIDDITRCFGQPFGDPACFPVFLLMLKQKSGPRFFLDGTGSDWYFGILPTFKDRLSVDIFRYIPFLQNVNNLIFRKSPKLSYKLRPPEERFVSWYGFGHGDISNMTGYRYDFRKTRLYNLCRSLWNENIIAYKTGVICEIWEPNAAYRKVEVIARYFSKIIRFPFTDKSLSDFVNTLTNENKFKGKNNKILLRKFLEKYLPGDILKKPKGSLVFNTRIILDYNNFEALRKYLNNDKIKLENIFSSSFIKNIVERYIQGDKTLSGRLFALVLFQSWLEQNQQVLDELRELH